MNNYIEYNDKIAFHPGYYIKEIVDESGLTQEDFAKRLDTTPKNLSLLIRGEQSLSIDISMKLSRMVGTSVYYWLNLQNAYDALIAEFRSEKELEEERKTFEYFDYKFFRDNYGLPDLPRHKDEPIKALRTFLNVSTLNVLRKRDMAVSFRNSTEDLTESCIVKANAMVQIAINKALKVDAPRFNKKQFEDSFWFTLFHEIGHIINGDYGISFEKERGEQEETANKFAQESLIPSDQYREFVENAKFDLQSIREFANRINRDPGIVLGRLQNDKLIDYDDWILKPLRHKYKVRAVV